MTRRHALLACVTIVAFRQSTHAHVPTAPDEHGYGLGHEAYAGGYAGPAHDVQGHGEVKARDETSSSKPNIVFFLTVRCSEERRGKDRAAKGSLLSLSFMPRNFSCRMTKISCWVGVSPRIPREG